MWPVFKTVRAVNTMRTSYSRSLSTAKRGCNLVKLRILRQKSESKFVPSSKLKEKHPQWRLSTGETTLAYVNLRTKI